MVAPQDANPVPTMIRHARIRLSVEGASWSFLSKIRRSRKTLRLRSCNLQQIISIYLLTLSQQNGMTRKTWISHQLLTRVLTMQSISFTRVTKRTRPNRRRIMMHPVPGRPPAPVPRSQSLMKPFGLYPLRYLAVRQCSPLWISWQLVFGAPRHHQALLCHLSVQPPGLPGGSPYPHHGSARW